MSRFERARTSFEKHKALGFLLIAYLTASCAPVIAEPSAPEIKPTDVPTLVVPSEGEVIAGNPPAVPNGHINPPEVQPTHPADPTELPQPTPSVEANATRAAVSRMIGYDELPTQKDKDILVEWAGNANLGLLGSPESFTVLNACHIVVTGDFPEGNTYTRGDHIVKMPDGGYFIFTSWATDNEGQRVEVDDLGYELVLVDLQYNPVLEYTPGQTRVTWEGPGGSVFIFEPVSRQFITLEELDYRIDLMEARSFFPNVVDIEYAEDGIAYGLDSLGTRVAQESGNEHPAWIEVSQVVELAPSLTPLELAQFNPNKDLAVWNEDDALAANIKYLINFLYVNSKGGDLGLHVSDEGINWVDKDRFNQAMEFAVTIINQQGIVALIDANYMDVNHPDAYNIVTDADGTPRVYTSASGEVLAQLAPGENLVKRITMVVSARKPLGFSGQEISGTWDLYAGASLTYLLDPQGNLTMVAYMPESAMRSATEDFSNHPTLHIYETTWLAPSTISAVIEKATPNPDTVWKWYVVDGQRRAFEQPGMPKPPFQDPNKNPAYAEFLEKMGGTSDNLESANDYNWAMRVDVFREQ